MCLVSGGGAYCEVVIVRRVEGEFSLPLICDIQHSTYPVTLPLHGWTEVCKFSTFTYMQIHTCIHVSYYATPPCTYMDIATTDQCEYTSLCM